ncbi:MAG: hypothetical protein IJQ82_03110 [Selenomonadaceae bacterium]|nr:hypothetical protein [Selenomonadaceae bacterium]
MEQWEKLRRATKKALNRVRELNQEIEELHTKIIEIRAAIRALSPQLGTPPHKSQHSQVETLAIKLVEAKEQLNQLIEMRDESATLLETKICRAGLTELEEIIMISYYVLCKENVWIMDEHEIGRTTYFQTRAQAEKKFLEKWRPSLL